MKRTTNVFIMLMVVIAISIAALQNPLMAHAQSIVAAEGVSDPFSGIDGRKCGGIEIHLIGNDKFDLKCLPKKQPTKSGQVTPQTNESSNSNCNSSDIVIHVDINYGNACGIGDCLYPLCINGAGSISNFKNIIVCETALGACSNDCFLYNCITSPTSWNDIASSFTTGAWYGRIYKDSNLSGDWAQFSPNESCADMRNMAYSYTSGPLNFNDSISSIWVGGTYSEGPIVC
jgi:hypothetical protein